MSCTNTLAEAATDLLAGELRDEVISSAALAMLAKIAQTPSTCRGLPGCRIQLQTRLEELPSFSLPCHAASFGNARWALH